MNSEHEAGRSGPGAFLRSRAGVALVAFLAIGAFFVLTEHTAHAFGVLPYSLLLLCPLLHLFMHGSHGGGHGGHGVGPPDNTQGDRR
jgi:hypothetical protein